MLQDNRALVGTSTPEMLAPLSDPDFPSLIKILNSQGPTDAQQTLGGQRGFVWLPGAHDAASNWKQSGPGKGLAADDPETGRCGLRQQGKRHVWVLNIT